MLQIHNHTYMYMYMDLNIYFCLLFFLLCATDWDCTLLSAPSRGTCGHNSLHGPQWGAWGPQQKQCMLVITNVGVLCDVVLLLCR